MPIEDFETLAFATIPIPSGLGGQTCVLCRSMCIAIMFTSQHSMVLIFASSVLIRLSTLFKFIDCCVTKSEVKIKLGT